MNKVLGKIAEGTWQPERMITVKQLFEEHWLPSQRTRGLKETTLAHYEVTVARYLTPRIGARKVATLTPQDIASLVEHLLTATSASGKYGLSSRTAQMAVGTLKSATAWALHNGLIARDPLAGVKRPSVGRKPMKIWTEDEARTFLNSVRGDRLEVAWALLLTRGPRRGEVAGIRWQDIDLDGKVWRLDHTRVVADGKAVDSTPKAGSSRAVPLDDHLVALLRAHRARQAAERLAAGEAYEDGGHLIADELGRPYYPDSLSTCFDRKVTDLGLPRIPLHDTRHTAASLMLKAGVPVKVVSEMLGHSSPRVTLEIYAHVMPGMAEEAGAALSAKLLA